MATKQAPVNQNTNSDYPGKTLAIVGLVFALFMPLVGLALSIIAYYQSKKAGVKNTIAIVGIIVNVIFNLLIVSFIVMMVAFGFWMFSTFSEATERDNTRKATMQYLGLEVTRYAQANTAYPASLQNLTSLSGFNSTTLTDSKGNSYSYTTTPEGCDIKTTCTGYIISIPAEVIKNQPRNIRIFQQLQSKITIELTKQKAYAIIVHVIDINKNIMSSNNQPPSEKPKLFQLFEERIVDGQHGVEPLMPTHSQEIDMNLALVGLDEVDAGKHPDGRYHIDKDRASRLGLVANLGDVKEVNE